ncbi:unnamed protein product [Owenia fusiformis]|uniref:C2H2-type domain-containing protein n=1 Tax=Owenia fusiformis TaxID=6347 RepID=A0A8S4PBX2_OWEFU|nr:unnamed protein product [Owenia fusiformis]
MDKDLVRESYSWSNNRLQRTSNDNLNEELNSQEIDTFGGIKTEDEFQNNVKEEHHDEIADSYIHIKPEYEMEKDDEMDDMNPPIKIEYDDQIDQGSHSRFDYDNEENELTGLLIKKEYEDYESVDHDEIEEKQNTEGCEVPEGLDHDTMVVGNDSNREGSGGPSCTNVELDNIETSETENQVDKFQCQYCEKKYKNKGTLKRHERIHTGEGIQCPYCEKCFGEKSHFKEHERIHTGDRPYNCGKCEKSYTSESALKKHESKHSGTRFMCSYCDQSYKSEETLKSHEKIHTGKGFECPYCAKCFGVRSHFKEHVRVHTGDRPYSCGECEKSYTTPIALKRHEAKHKGTRFICSYCDQSFAQKGYVARHEKKVHFKNVS